MKPVIVAKITEKSLIGLQFEQRKWMKLVDLIDPTARDSYERTILSDLNANKVPKKQNAQILR